MPWGTPGKFLEKLFIQRTVERRGHESVRPLEKHSGETYAH